MILIALPSLFKLFFFKLKFVSHLLPQTLTIIYFTLKKINPDPFWSLINVCWPTWTILFFYDSFWQIGTHCNKLWPIITHSCCFLHVNIYPRSPSIIVICRKTLEPVFLVKTFICETLWPAAHSSLGSSNTDSYLWCVYWVSTLYILFICTEILDINNVFGNLLQYTHRPRC